MDKEWREVHIHTEQGAHENDVDNDDVKGGRCASPTTLTGLESSMASNHRLEEEENEEWSNNAATHHMFDTQRAKSSYEDIVYEFPSMKILNLPASYTDAAIKETSSRTNPSKSTSITIRHQGDYPFSTGLAVWGGSELMAGYLVQNPNLVKAKRVLELGAGTGLCGIVAHRLGASTVAVSDGDVDVLQNLRFNVQWNEMSETDHAKLPAANIFCPQLIWGKNLDQFAESFGLQDVILASDCVYMVPSLEPLWQTVDRLLVRKNDTDALERPSSSNNGIFLWVNLCASAASLESVLETATRYGFTWDQPKYGDTNQTFDEETLKMFKKQVYLFQRK
ncbi:methyltransferase [Nitzschia inconspicua]|uniref:Methyltransferase n=1 Tax=Nitzschia inconspicua TaxID=303405 RepID=A0A9K3KEQ1_9STRA|nr:methyltransferase [Nitzschia inconspicua]